MPNRIIVKCISFLCMAALVVLFPLLSVAEPIVIRFSHVVSEDTPKGIGAKLFKKTVEERLSGRVEVKIFPRSEKYTDGEALEALLSGDLEMAAPSFPKFSQYTKAFQVFDLPFLFLSVEEVHRYQKSEPGRQLLKAIEAKGIRGLEYWDNGMRVIAANRELKTPADLRGMKIRVEPSLVIQKQYAQLGAETLVIPYKQLFGALKNNEVDGFENAWSNIVSSELYTLRQHYIEAGHSYLGYMVVTSVKFWEGLPVAIRQELEAILAKVTVEVNRLAVERAKTDRDKVLQTEGIQVFTASAEEIKVWKEAMMPVWKEWNSK